jgi:hypothetical protein
LGRFLTRALDGLFILVKDSHTMRIVGKMEKLTEKERLKKAFTTLQKT